MDTIQLVVLALIQGLTEFLPISSSGHLILPSKVLGWPDQGLAFDVAVHVGSLIAVLFYFRVDVINLIRAWFKSFSGTKSHDSQLAWIVIWATVPAALAGYLFDDFIETNLRSVAVIATTTVLFGLLLGWADFKGTRSINLQQMTFKQAMLIGASQMLALIPGTSRSGITMTTALAIGMERQAAARFSFLLSIPLIALSGGYKALGLLHEESIAWGDIALGTGLAAISAAACIHFFLAWIDRAGMLPFVIYRLLLGAVLFYFVY